MLIVRRTDYTKKLRVMNALLCWLDGIRLVYSRIPSFKQCTQLLSQLYTTAANTTRHSPHAVFL